jgi:hypothetical protein
MIGIFERNGRRFPNAAFEEIPARRLARAIEWQSAAGTSTTLTARGRGSRSCRGTALSASSQPSGAAHAAPPVQRGGERWGYCSARRCRHLWGRFRRRSKAPTVAFAWCEGRAEATGVTAGGTASASLQEAVSVITRHVHFVQIRGHSVGSGTELNLPAEETRKSRCPTAPPTLFSPSPSARRSACHRRL